jgi:hypothetical protein
MISSRHLRYRYQIFQNFKPVAIVAVPVDERKKLGGGSEQLTPRSGPRINREQYLKVLLQAAEVTALKNFVESIIFIAGTT